MGYLNGDVQVCGLVFGEPPKWRNLDDTNRRGLSETKLGRLTQLRYHRYRKALVTHRFHDEAFLKRQVVVIEKSV